MEKLATTVSEPHAKREYKDTVFRMLFSDKEKLLSLYNAMNDRHYENAEDLKIVTLKNAIYMGMKNDLAFMVDTQICLYEHQSTKNPNMPLRDMFYISLEYQAYVNNKSRTPRHCRNCPLRSLSYFIMEQKIWKSVQNSACPMHMRIWKGSRT